MFSHHTLLHIPACVVRGWKYTWEKSSKSKGLQHVRWICNEKISKKCYQSRSHKIWDGLVMRIFYLISIYKWKMLHPISLTKNSINILLALVRWCIPWWCHQMETFSVLLAICVGSSPVPSEFPAQRPVMRSFDVFFDLCLNKLLNKQSWGWWFETLLCPLWRRCNA